MFKRLSISLTKPPRLVFFIKDSWKRIILYLILLPLILLIPSLIYSVVQPGMSVSRYNELSAVLKTDFDLNGQTIVNGVFQTTDIATAQYMYMQITTSKSVLTPAYMSFLLESDGITIYVGTLVYHKVSYADLGLYNYTFDFTDTANLRIFTSAIKTVYEMQSFSTYIELITQYFMGLIDFLFVVFLLAVMDGYIIANQPFKFKLRFKLSVYATSIYMFAQLIFTLIGYSQLNFISIIIAYGYHIWIYSKLKVVPKGVDINGGNK